jgi:hypothetical protein
LKTDDRNKELTRDEVVPSGYVQVPWPDHGREVFGPWCLLGPWPALFDVVEKIEKPENGKEDPHAQ